MFNTIKENMNMEVSLEAIISLVGLFVGGGVGSVFTWRYQRKKAKAEAQQAENDVKKAEQEANQAAVQTARDVQETYDRILQAQNQHFEEQQKYIDEIRLDRQQLRQEKIELRDRLDKTDDEIRTLKREVARNGRQVDMMRPFICADTGCKLRQRVTTIDELDHTKPTVGNDLHK